MILDIDETVNEKAVVEDLKNEYGSKIVRILTLEWQQK